MAQNTCYGTVYVSGNNVKYMQVIGRQKSTKKHKLFCKQAICFCLGNDPQALNFVIWGALEQCHFSLRHILFITAQIGRSRKGTKNAQGQRVIFERGIKAIRGASEAMALVAFEYFYPFNLLQASFSNKEICA